MGKAKSEEGVSSSFNPLQFGRDAWGELRKVHHPTRQETLAATIGVFLMVVFFSVLLGIVDYVVGHLMAWVLSWDKM